MCPHSPPTAWAPTTAFADGTYYFYAHLDRYADGIELGAKVRAGEAAFTG